MTYKELVNAVLIRLREDEVDSIAAADAYGKMVAAMVNDAKRHVEDAWKWNALRSMHTINTVAGTAKYSLTGAGKYATIETVLNADTASYLGTITLMEMRRRDAVYGSTTSFPQTYAIEGVDVNQDVQLRLSPTPNDTYNIQVDVFQRTPDLSSDDDVLLVPDQPVFYRALALAARERGEVGGQTAAELFAEADRYLASAISLDAAQNPSDLIWFQE